MHQNDGTIFCYDPFNNLRIKLPCKSNCTYYSYYDMMHFLHPPTSTHCFIVGVDDFDKTLWIGILEHGLRKWERHKYGFQKRFWISKSTPVLRNRLLYFLSMKGDVAVLNLDKQKLGGGGFAWRIYTKCLRPRRLREKIQENFLLRIEDAIFAVFVMYDVGETRVYKLLEPKMEWELVKDLGDKVLYVSHLSSFGVTAPVKSMAGNTINFAQLHVGSLVFYSLEDGKYRSFHGGNYSSNILYGHERLDFAAWISPLPRRRRTDMVPEKRV